jgi:para-aminobenzoate synthetase component 1
VRPIVHELVPVPDPVRCCEQLDALPYRLLLDSAVVSGRLGRYSFLMADPAIVVRSRGTVVECLSGPAALGPSAGSGSFRARSMDGFADAADAAPRSSGDVLSVVRDLLSPFATEPIEGLPPFQGGAAGYLAYDWSRVLERLPSPAYDDLALDDVVLGIYDWVLAWDHIASKAWLVSTGMPERAEPLRSDRAERRAAWVRERLVGAAATGATPAAPAAHRRAVAGFNQPVSPPGGTMPTAAVGAMAPSHAVTGGWWDPALALRSSFTRAGYLAAVSRVRDYIFAGDIFQANLSQRFEAPLAEPPWSLYLRLRRGNPAPFAAFMELPHATVLSASPERFLHVDVQGRVETRPIKGTRPRGLGPEHDAALGQALTESDKDRAENLMIVDLMRNDLSRVCAPGSVRVPELFALERYATVHHLVSTVVGELEPGSDALDLLRAAFPGGSITGAPKLRAMEIIAELEPSRRGVYCGSIGYWSLTGELDTNIAIRTALALGGRVYFNAGGGVIADSSPEQEYLETLDKARGIIDALAVSV